MSADTTPRSARAQAPDVAPLVRARRARTRRRAVITGVLLLAALAVYVGSIALGREVFGLDVVWRVATGEDVEGATFTVGTLRLPRATLALLAGFCFGLGGVAFQTMLRNPLASPDFIGISAGASAAAAVAIVGFSLGRGQVATLAVAASLAIALLIYLLAYRDGVLGTRLILIGIGIAAMLDSVIGYVILRASEWDLQAALRWLTGSLNGVQWPVIVPVVLAMLVLVPILLSQSRNLALLQLGDNAASALGVRVERTRILVILAAVGLIAFATSASGPIAFVAFLSGPIAARIVPPGRSLLVPAALVGALLVLVADFAGQYLVGTRYPVGVVTGALGAPYLLYLLVRTNRSGGLA